MLSNARQVSGLRAQCFGALLLTTNAVAAAPVDLNGFFFEPGTPVTVSADGLSATLAESSDIGVVFLSNVPGLGDPQVIVAGAGNRLRFDYRFEEPLGNADVFHVALLDGNSGAPLGGTYELFVTATQNGFAEFDLSSLSGLALGLQYELSPELSDAGLDSIVTISNLQLVPVPAPAALGLLSSALLTGTCLRKRKACVRRLASH